MVRLGASLQFGPMGGTSKKVSRRRKVAQCNGRTQSLTDKAYLLSRADDRDVADFAREYGVRGGVGAASGEWSHADS